MTLADKTSLAAALLLVGLALLAGFSLPGDGALPMQWTFAGDVVWSAPRRLALSLIPAVGLLVLAASSYASHRAQASGGSQIAIAIALLAVDIAHLIIARRYT